MKCDVCGTEYSRVGGKDPKVSSSEVGNTFPLLKHDHLFTSQAELDDYERRVAEREANLSGGLDAAQQAELQPGQVDIRNMPAEPDLGYIMSLLRDPVKAPQAFRTYGPTKYMHALSAFAQASGIRDRGDGFVVAPDLLPQLGSLTVARAKQLAGY